MELQTLLLYGGIALLALGIIAGIVVLIVLWVRRPSRTGGQDAVPQRAAGPELASTSPFAAFQVAPSEHSDSSSLSAAFVAGPRPGGSGAGSGSTGSGESSSSMVWGDRDGVSGSDASSEAAPLAPTVPAVGAAPSLVVAPDPAAAVPAWQDIVVSALDADPFQYTTGSFAAPSPLAAAAATASSAADADPAAVPFANPWADTGSEPQAASAPPAAQVPPAPVSAPAADEAPAPVSAPAPDALSAPPTVNAPPVILPTSELEEDEHTVHIAGRGRQIAPWLLILDSGEQVGVTADSVVLGRKPATIEHGAPGVTIPDPTKTLSKVHARLDRVGDQWQITDLGSTNGTSLVEIGGRERQLAEGDAVIVRGRFLLGEVGLVLVRNPESGR